MIVGAFLIISAAILPVLSQTDTTAVQLFPPFGSPPPPCGTPLGPIAPCLCAKPPPDDSAYCCDGCRDFPTGCSAGCAGFNTQTQCVRGTCSDPSPPQPPAPEPPFQPEGCDSLRCKDFEVCLLNGNGFAQCFCDVECPLGQTCDSQGGCGPIPQCATVDCIAGTICVLQDDIVTCVPVPSTTPPTPPTPTSPTPRPRPTLPRPFPFPLPFPFPPSGSPLCPPIPDPTGPTRCLCPAVVSPPVCCDGCNQFASECLAGCSGYDTKRCVTGTCPKNPSFPGIPFPPPRFPFPLPCLSCERTTNRL